MLSECLCTVLHDLEKGFGEPGVKMVYVTVWPTLDSKANIEFAKGRGQIAAG
jgi:hypothetical protein